MESLRRILEKAAPNHFSEKVSENDGRLYFSLWFSILDNANKKYNIVPGANFENMQDIPYTSRNKIAYQAFSDWDKTLDDWMRSFGGTPDFNVGEELYNWRKNRFSGVFAVAEFLPKGAIFIYYDPLTGIKPGTPVFLVKGLANTVREVLTRGGMKIPTLVSTTVLPWKGSYIYDGIMMPVSTDPVSKKECAAAIAYATLNGLFFEHAPTEHIPQKRVNIPAQMSALDIKNMGNEHYKKSLTFVDFFRKCADALLCYQEAQKKDPSNPVYLSNMSAVYFEIGDYENCLKSCEKSLESNVLTTEQKSRISLRLAKSSYFLKNFSVAKQHDSLLTAPATNSSPKEWPKVNNCRHTLIPAFEYYPIGNEAAIALTDSEKEYPYCLDYDLLWSNGQKTIDLLFIGMSDLRHLLVTLEDIILSDHTYSVFALLNDITPYVLARNVLLLYLFSSNEPNKEYFTFVYYVWMAINLTRNQHSMLNDSLDKLIEMSQNSETWKNSCMNFIDMSDRDRETVRNVWLSWRQEPMTPVSDLKLGPVDDELVDSILGSVKNKELAQFPRIQNKVNDYFNKTQTILPPDNILIENPPDTWVVNATLLTPKIWEQLKEKYPLLEPPALCISQPSLIDEDEDANHFDDIIPQTINSFLKKSETLRAMLKENSLKIRVEIGDALQITHSPFDRIYTSNVCDYVGLLNILLHFVPLLKKVPHASVQTNIMYSLGQYQDNAQYYFTCFGRLHESPKDYMCLERTEGETILDVYRWGVVNKALPDRAQDHLLLPEVLTDWIYSVFLLCNKPAQRKGIAEPPGLTMMTFIKFIQFLADIGYPTINIAQCVVNILKNNVQTVSRPPSFWPDLVDKEFLIPKVHEENVINFRDEFEYLLSMSLNKLSFPISFEIRDPSAFCYVKGSIPIFQKEYAKLMANNALGVLVLRNANQKKALLFEKIKEDFYEGIEAMRADAQLYSCCDWDGFNCVLGLWVPKDIAKDKTAEVVLLRMDEHLIISEFVPLTSFQ